MTNSNQCLLGCAKFFNTWLEEVLDARLLSCVHKLSAQLGKEKEKCATLTQTIELASRKLEVPQRPSTSIASE